ncbi:MAG TPA: glutamate--tRNA ligase [Gammaproteobacteria bacterium]|nr:glutamate--tRNA ligase [Gammaproteobacteria bacterium]
MTIRTRFAPSPTGYLHIGGVRTALFSWLHACHNGGQFVMRIEDTDRLRSTQASVDAILEGMQWLGLDWDEGPFYQTQRFPRYTEVINELLEHDLAYPCYCSREALETMREQQKAAGIKPRYDRRCRDRTAPPPPGVEPVIRFKNPLEGAVEFDDVIRGRIVISNQELDDLIIARPDGTPTYNFTVVVDDMDMAITDVIRGDDHVNNTPRQINIFNALGAQAPRYAHVPMILGGDGKRLSKRHGAVSVLEYREQGFLPEALLNYLLRLGWSHGDQEIFSREEMVDLFDLGTVNHSASTFNAQKLVWLNEHYIKTGDLTDKVARFGEMLAADGLNLEHGPAVRDVYEVQMERAKTLVEMVEKSRVFYTPFPGFDEKAAHKYLKLVVAEPLEALRNRWQRLPDWRAEPIHDVLKQFVAETGIKFGKIAQPVRVAITGTAVSPALDKTLWLLGQEQSMQRLSHALAWIRSRESG